MPMPVLGAPSKASPQQKPYPVLVAWILMLELCLQSYTLLQLASSVHQCVPLVGRGEQGCCLAYGSEVP